ncbi:hypothetical protein J6590_048971 [Homalodisca vitripennis]|nr:hypothetical protein J6590_048971 [Homalodisca vitripennis]
MSAEQLLYQAIHPSPAIVRSVDSEPNLQRASGTGPLPVGDSVTVKCIAIRTGLHSLRQIRSNLTFVWDISQPLRVVRFLTVRYD